MKIIVFGAGQQCKKFISNIKNTDQILAIADNEWEKNNKTLMGHPIISPKEITDYEYDKIIIAVYDFEEKGCHQANEIVKQLIEMGIPKKKIMPIDIYGCDFSRDDSRRVGFLFQLAKILKKRNVIGAVAECGVYRGWFAKHINEYFNDRTLYLFDTFSGFDERDMEQEPCENPYFTMEGYDEIKYGSEEIALLRCPYPEKVIIKRGYVPDTFQGLENEKFAFVNLDMDLYLPQLQALRFFAKRMTKGGVILLHDYYDIFSVPDVKIAVDEFSKECKFKILPICDGCSIALIFEEVDA